MSVSIDRSFSLPVGRTVSYAVRPTSAPVRVEGAFSGPVWLGWLDAPNHAAFLAGEPYVALYAQIGDRFQYILSLPPGRPVHLLAWNREGFVPVTGTVTLSAEPA